MLEPSRIWWNFLGGGLKSRELVLREGIETVISKSEMFNPEEISS